MAKRRKGGSWLVRALSVAAAVFLVLVSVQEKLGTDLGLPNLSSLTTLLRELSLGQTAPVSTGTSDAPLRVHYINVGQGKSILIQTPEQNVLIDAGEREQGPVVLGYLHAQGVRRLELIVATHPHSDHIGGLSAILKEFEVGQILMPEISAEMTPASSVYSDLLETIAARNLTITVAKPGDTYPLGVADLQLLAPLNHYDDLNAYSIVSRLDFGANTFLFTGDATKDTERDMLAAESELRATVLDVAHHGSNTSSIEDFLLAASPQIAVISCGEDNTYGHPHRDVVERLEKLGAEILRTDISGNIIIRSDGEALEVETER